MRSRFFSEARKAALPIQAVGFSDKTPGFL